MYNKQGSTALSSYEYTYYPSGNQSTKTDHTGKRTTYIYDGLGRLEQESDTSGLSIDYFYDASQNRSSMYVDNGDESYYIYYTYNANNQLTQERKRQDGVYTTIGTYTYDGNGNQLTKTGTDGTQTYTYNGFNQQTGFAFGTVAASYTYNTSGIRTSKAINEARTSYLLDGGYVAAELQAGDTTPTTYLWGNNLIRREDGSDTSYYLYNAHGDVINLTNTAGAVTKTYGYSAFGIEQNPDTTDTNPFRYCGEYYDAETETYYLRARYYNPAVGRFTQADSVRYVLQKLPNGSSTIDPLSLNHYSYCANNPTRYCDPSGHMPVALLNSISYSYNQGKYTQARVSDLVLFHNLNNIGTGFHEIAQINVAKQLFNTGKTPILEYRLVDIGEVDIVADGFAWEVKPKGKYDGPKQLKKYITNTGLNAGYSISEITDIPIIEDIKMKIWSVGNYPGVIKYSFYEYDENGKRKSVSSADVMKKCEARRNNITIAVGTSLVLTTAALLTPPVLAAAAGYGAGTHIEDLIIAAQEVA